MISSLLLNVAIYYHDMNAVICIIKSYKLHHEILCHDISHHGIPIIQHNSYHTGSEIVLKDEYFPIIILSWNENETNKKLAAEEYILNVACANKIPVIVLIQDIDTVACWTLIHIIFKLLLVVLVFREWKIFLFYWLHVEGHLSSTGCMWLHR